MYVVMDKRFLLDFAVIDFGKTCKIKKLTFFKNFITQPYLSADIDDKVNTRPVKASAAFCRLLKNVWTRRGITQIDQNQGLGSHSSSDHLPVWLWIMNSLLMSCKEAEPLLHLSQKTTGITWQDKIPDTEVLICVSIYAIVRQSQLCRVGHVARIPDHQLPKRLLWWTATRETLPRRPDKAF